MSPNPASAPDWGLPFGVACENNGHSRAKIRLKAVQVTIKARDSALGPEGWGRAVHYEDCVLCWMVINKNWKLSSALFLHSKSMLEGTEMLWIIWIMVLLTRCALPSQPFLLVMTSCRMWNLAGTSSLTKLWCAAECDSKAPLFHPHPGPASPKPVAVAGAGRPRGALPASLPRSKDSRLHSQLDSLHVTELVL